MIKLKIFVFLFTPLALTAQSPVWSWAHNGGGTLYDFGYSVAADPYGNSYVAGAFESQTATFGTNTAGCAMADTSDVFLSKYDNNGNCLWVERAGGVRQDEATSVAVDFNGNVVITGFFYSSTITFGAYTLTNHSGYSDMFIAKYDSSGTVLWARNAGGAYDDQGAGVSTDPIGDIVVTGFFLADTINFGSDAIYCAGTYDAFLVKYDSGGNEIWARGIGNAGDDRGCTVTAAANGDIFVAGTFYTSGLMIASDSLLYAGGAYSDIFLAKFNSTGNPLWGRAIGGTYLDEPASVGADLTGNVYLAANVYSASVVLGNDTIVNSGTSFYCDILLAGFDANGFPQWTQHHGVGTGNDIAHSIIVNGTGDLWMVGLHGPNIVFGSTVLSGTGLFLTRYTTTGTVILSEHVSGAFPYGVAFDNMGNVVVAGAIYDPVVNFGTHTLNSYGFYDAFVAKYDLSTDVTQQRASEMFTIYPDPVNDQLFINGIPETESCELTITNVAGEIVMQKVMQIGEKSVDLSSLAEGAYLLALKSKSLTSQNRIAVIH